MSSNSGNSFGTEEEICNQSTEVAREQTDPFELTVASFNPISLPLMMYANDQLSRNRPQPNYPSPMGYTQPSHQVENSVPVGVYESADQLPFIPPLSSPAEPNTSTTNESISSYSQVYLRKSKREKETNGSSMKRGDNTKNDATHPSSIDRDYRLSERRNYLKGTKRIHSNKRQSRSLVRSPSHFKTRSHNKLGKHFKKTFTRAKSEELGSKCPSSSERTILDESAEESMLCFKSSDRARGNSPSYMRAILTAIGYGIEEAAGQNRSTPPAHPCIFNFGPTGCNSSNEQSSKQDRIVEEHRNSRVMTAMPDIISELCTKIDNNLVMETEGGEYLDPPKYEPSSSSGLQGAIKKTQLFSSNNSPSGEAGIDFDEENGAVGESKRERLRPHSFHLEM